MVKIYKALSKFFLNVGIYLSSEQELWIFPQITYIEIAGICNKNPQFPPMCPTALPCHQTALHQQRNELKEQEYMLVKAAKDIDFLLGGPLLRWFKCLS